MPVMVVDERKEPITGPYVVRMGGWTLERYLREAPEDQIWEFVRGEIIMHSPATAEHQRVTGFLYRLLQGYCEARGWGEVLMAPAALQVLPEVVREPDVFVVPPEEMERARGVPLTVRPALVVEVTSPATRGMDLGEKAAEYREAGIPEYWVVDRERQEVVAQWGTEVMRVREGRLISRAVPGFWLAVEWLFQEPLPPASACLQRILSEKAP
ncbi:MAG: Uma2 family endonuclease [Thermoflexus sp.]|uniref:Uma2 family endonuclease n=1 Tax=Thermoflexus sp. TaxID=1969742 RepID=UPI0025EF38F2|nr:Uma2 family endonuclease [Thermoflexus sp.]MCS6964140.1 Uma2 family endonuclease [Thermoflexus sp.]